MTYDDQLDGGTEAREVRRPPSRPTARVALAMALALTTALGACGNGGDQSSTAATVGSNAVDPAGAVSPVGDIAAGTLTGGPGSGASFDVDGPAEIIGPPLEGGSSADDIRSAVEDALGPTDDLSAQVNRFVTFPPLPTPARTELIELRADVRTAEDGDTMLVSCEVTFTADGDVDGLAELLAGELADLGWAPAEPVSSIGSPGGYRRVYAPGGGEYPIDDAELSIVATGPVSVSFPRSEVRLRISLIEPDDALGVRERFEHWADDVPLPDGGNVTGAGFQTSSVGRDSLHFFLHLVYDEVRANDVARQLRAELPANDLTIQPQPSAGPGLDNWVYLDSPFFDDLWISTHERRNPARTTIVNVDGRVGLGPAT